MGITSNTVALFSIGSSAVVAIAGIGVPTWVHISDRRHEARLRLAERREPTYVKLAHLMFTVRMHQDEKGKKLSEEMVGTMTIWASEKVRKLFGEWVELFPTSYGPNKNPEQDRKVFEASEKLRIQMSREIQLYTSKGTP